MFLVAISGIGLDGMGWKSDPVQLMSRAGADLVCHKPNRNPVWILEPAHTSSSIEGISLYDIVDEEENIPFSRVHVHRSTKAREIT